MLSDGERKGRLDDPLETNIRLNRNHIQTHITSKQAAVEPAVYKSVHVNIIVILFSY